MNIYDLMENKVIIEKGTSKQFIEKISNEGITDNFYFLEDIKELILPNIKEEKLAVIPVRYISIKEYIKNLKEI